MKKPNFYNPNKLNLDNLKKNCEPKSFKRRREINSIPRNMRNCRKDYNQQLKKYQVQNK